MTANENGFPQDPDREAARAREEIGKTAEVPAAKVDRLEERAQEKAVQAKDTVAEQAGHAVRATRDKAGQVKDKASDLVSPEREGAALPAITSPPAVRGARVGAVTIGLATALVVWLLRRRARRNDPWRAAVRNVRSQVKTLRRQTKSSLKATREHSREQAASQVVAAKAKARKAKSWK
jgi:hypothetical protein